MSILVLAQIFSNTCTLNCRQEACGMLYYDVQPNRKSRKKSMVLYCKTSVVLLHVEKCYQDEFSTLNLKWTAFLSKYIQDWVPNISEKTRPAPCIYVYIVRTIHHQSSSKMEKSANKKTTVHLLFLKRRKNSSRTNSVRIRF